MEIIKNITRTQLANILKEDGYMNVDMPMDIHYTNSVIVKVNGHVHVFTIYENKLLQASYLIDNAKISLEAINNWNKNRLLSRASSHNDGGKKVVCFDAELFMAAGVHKENIIEFVSDFITLCPTLHDYINLFSYDYITTG